MPQDQVERDSHTTSWYDCNWGSDNRVWVVSRQGDLYHVEGASDGVLHGGTYKGDLYHVEGALSPWGSVHDWVDQHPDLDHGDVHAIVMWRPKMAEHLGDPSEDLFLVWTKGLHDAIQKQRRLSMD